MATQEQEMQVTRASVLRKPDDWSKWLFTRKMSADRNSLWEYVNPDLLPEKLKKLEDERPKELEVRRFRNPLPDEQIDIPDLTATEFATYNAWSRRFDRYEAKWLTKQKALRSLSLGIVQTIDVKHLDLILSCADAHDQLKTLKSLLCLSIHFCHSGLICRNASSCICWCCYCCSREIVLLESAYCGEPGILPEKLFFRAMSMKTFFISFHTSCEAGVPLTYTNDTHLSSRYRGVLSFVSTHRPCRTLPTVRESLRCISTINAIMFKR